MEPTDDGDIKLQRASADLLSDLQACINRLLWRSSGTCGQNTRLLPAARTVVRERNTDQLLKLLEPFQEWPQLLDPHLNSLVPALVSAFIDYLTKHTSRYRSKNKPVQSGTIPLPRAISKIVYCLCKVRGEKVIRIFLSNEPKYLEPMLDAFQVWNEKAPMTDDGLQDGYGPMVWEERYTMLLWLSHLMLAPFDLASISSTDIKPRDDSSLANINLPKNLPPIVKRLVPICMTHLMSASKEREASKALFVRMALRPDMYQAGLLDISVIWALSELESSSSTAASSSIYGPVGILSFLAGIVISAEKAIIAPYLLRIFQTIQRINAQATQVSKDICSSALARKVIVKIVRAISVLFLADDSSIPSLSITENFLEEIISHLLDAVSDKDTPVRYAASKALSVIALKLEPSMAAEVIEAVIGSLNEDVLWRVVTSHALDNYSVSQSNQALLSHDLSAVNPLRWHGLVLTLAQLLFRRSPPAEQLPIIINALFLALVFEQRSAVGSSIGTNVRDAACFGIWAMSRRYTTKEMIQIDTTAIQAVPKDSIGKSVLQLVANELVAAACLDPSGNIRRGASAALQELIGRHPDEILDGISLVQVIDYHAVALQSRAKNHVATSAAKLDDLYLNVILRGLLGWRGIESPDAESRRQSAVAVGALRDIRDAYTTRIIECIRDSLRRLSLRQVEERHGLILAYAAVIDGIRLSRSSKGLPPQFHELQSQLNLIQNIFPISAEGLLPSTSRSELTAEAACTLIAAACALLIDYRTLTLSKFPHFVKHFGEVLTLSLAYTEDIVIAKSSKAISSFLPLLSPTEREGLIGRWIVGFKTGETGRPSRGGKEHGTISALGAAYSCLYFIKDDPAESTKLLLINVLLSHASPSTSIETRLVALRSLAADVLKYQVPTKSMIDVIFTCLSDYTTDQRGDIGSLIRLEAIDSVDAIASAGYLPLVTAKQGLLAAICRLAAEKLDKVRFRAWTRLQKHWNLLDLETLDTLAETPIGQGHLTLFPIGNGFQDLAQISTLEYFRQILSLYSVSFLRLDLLKGLVTSAGGGSESLLTTSRTALLRCMEQPTWKEQLNRLLCQDLVTIIRSEISNERIILPALEVLGFLLDMGIFQEWSAFEIADYRSFFTLVQKAHFKSTNQQKICACISIYAHLVQVPALRSNLLTKLISMLLHPYPQIRNAAADKLFVTVPQSDLLENEDWSSLPKTLKPVVDQLRERLVPTSNKI